MVVSYLLTHLLTMSSIL